MDKKPYKTTRKQELNNIKMRKGHNDDKQIVDILLDLDTDVAKLRDMFIGLNVRLQKVERIDS